MWLFVGLTLLILFGLLYTFAKVNQKEVLDHWEQYNKNPIFVFFFAPFYKPDNDGRSQLEFAADNFYNVLMSFCNETMQILMQPLMAIINMMTSAINQTVDGLFNVRGLLKVMWTRFNSMTDAFMKRFEATLNALRATYTKLYNAMGKTYAISVAGLMSGLSALQTTLSLFDLMVNVCLTILVILAAIFIWLPFLLIPVIIIIIMCVNAINDSGQGDKVTGIAGVFCFAEGTQVDTKDGPFGTQGGPQSIETIQLNQILADNGVVNGILNFEHPISDMYSLYGVHVSGSHIVYENNKPLFVKDHPDATKLPDQQRKVVCLITSTRRIPIVTPQGPVEFADWEEIDNELEELKEWNQQVFKLLNPGQTYVEPSMTSMFSESGVSATTRIKTLNGTTIKASDIRPGSTILSADGTPTKVRGVVKLTGKEVVNCSYLSDGASISAGTWVKQHNTWIQHCHLTPMRPSTPFWYQFFTESGTFVIQDGAKSISVRDFTDVGSDELHKTYDWVLKVLLGQKI